MSIMENTDEAIKIVALNKYYGSEQVLDEISFTVEKGKIHGFIGPNGAGKSTTLNILSGLVHPSSGAVYVDGKSVVDDPRFNENMIFIPAEFKMPEQFTVQKYLRTIITFAALNIPNLKILILDEIRNVLISTHILSDLQEIADDITMIKRGPTGGKIVYTGPKMSDIQKTYEEFFFTPGDGEARLFS
ncbi:396_t:CDS:2 [Gigaspora margarita]|uniref:396_t:CDS:1 n=1 Tax=Gigaspora margarita TaxID=4874 RepID=A0ABM8VWZ4_GIGMA|nr:396_t:CDS:2 [Gigaspora margarita]